MKKLNIKIILAILILIAVVLIAGCTNKPSTGTTASTKQIFTNSAYGYSLEVPNGWSKAPFSRDDYINIVLTEDTYAEKGFIVADIVISSTTDYLGKPISNYNLNEFVDSYSKNDITSGTKIVAKNDLTIAGVPAKSLDTLYEMYNGQIQKSKYIILIKGNKGYIILYYPSFTNAGNYDKYLKNFDTVVNSFKFI